MQGVGNTILSLQQAMLAFENKLELFITDIETGRLLNFENRNLKIHAQPVPSSLSPTSDDDDVNDEDDDDEDEDDDFIKNI
ncbi:general transcription factor ii-i repeat domain-containing 2-like protein [Plakobranchus ocellatus]|uniref:General transcription factor ii-i repeat domain-containing 2-like protein n=1 Tax=Plakobranchus ocellatus TaxID=259542 RepID=A0AAV3YPE4_9GAST|nr:general transcription factor ii-i repeat domain-containing 2-like protein [Plakobranchus ocellatus]